MRAIGEIVCWDSNKVHRVGRGRSGKCGEEKRKVGLEVLMVISSVRNEKMLTKDEEMSEEVDRGGKLGNNMMGCI